jgi:hypothetical protein
MILIPEKSESLKSMTEIPKLKMKKAKRLLYFDIVFIEDNHIKVVHAYTNNAKNMFKYCKMAEIDCDIKILGIHQINPNREKFLKCRNTEFMDFS